MNAPHPPARTATHSPLGGQTGFTVVEILVALVAGLVLSAGIFQVFVSSKQTYQVGDQMSRLQENSRLAVEFLARDIRMAGSLGCTSQVVAKIFNTLNWNTSLYYNFAVPVEGYEATGTTPGSSFSLSSEYLAPTATKSKWTPNLPSDATVSPAIVGETIEGSDVLAIRGRVGRPVFLSGISTSQLTVQSLPTGLVVDDIAMVADCAITRVFKVTDIDGANLAHAQEDDGKPGNTCGDWAGQSGAFTCRKYDFPTTASSSASPAEVSEVATTLYFISRRDYNSQTDQYIPPPSLYRRIGANAKEELVEGVENMQILYGISDASGNVQFVPASSVANWASANVVSIRIGLLMRTPDYAALTTDTSTYDVNGTTIDPYDDRRLRKVITTTIGIRTQLN